MRRRKESGFTLIELMIVIAVIGILAIVLVPRIGTIKTQSKEAGLDTNIRVVQGYCESKINKWVANETEAATIQGDIIAAFSGNKQLTNPITSVTANVPAAGLAPVAGGLNPPVFVVSTVTGADITGTDTTTRGTIVVAILDNPAGDAIEGINIYAHGDNGMQLAEKNVEVRP